MLRSHLTHVELECILTSSVQIFDFIYIGKSCWELYCLEHDINPDGTLSANNLAGGETDFTTFFTETDSVSIDLFYMQLAFRVLQVFRVTGKDQRRI